MLDNTNLEEKSLIKDNQIKNTIVFKGVVYTYDDLEKIYEESSKKKEWVSKKHFTFGSDIEGKVYFKKTWSNIFITFTDLADKVIVCKTSGNSGVGSTKRLKRNAYSITSILNELEPYFTLYNIQSIRLVMLRKRNFFFKFLLREFEERGLKVSSILMRRRVAHNGVRGRKKKRL